METRTVNVYEFGELSDAAKARAISDDQARDDWARADEYMDSLKALARHFGGKLSDYSINWCDGAGPSSVEFEMPEREESAHSEDNQGKREWEKGIREKLAALGSYNKKTLRGNGDCKLTGCGTDESAIDGFRAAFIRGGERDLNALMQAAFDSWIKAAHEDYDYDYGEGYAETADANGWRYYEDGRMAR